MSDVPVADDDLDGDYEDDEDEAAPDPNRRPGASATTVLEYLVGALVDDPGAVTITLEEARRGLSLRVNVAPEDMGRVIGRRGRTANAIRTLVRAAAVRDGVEVDVDFVD